MARGRRLAGLLRSSRCFAAFSAASQRRFASTLTPTHKNASGHNSHGSKGSSAASSAPAKATASQEQQQPALAAFASGRLPLDVPAYIVWGANTNVGKTLVSVGLAHAAAAHKVPLAYVKPVQTGFPADSDARLVALASGGRSETGTHAAETAALVASTTPSPSLSSAACGTEAAASEACSGDPGAVNSSSSSSGEGGRAASSGSSSTASAVQSRCTTLFAWQHAVSAHLAARLEGRTVGDEQLVAATAVHVRQVMEEIRTSHSSVARRTTTAPSCPSSGAAVRPYDGRSISDAAAAAPDGAAAAVVPEADGGSSGVGGLVLVETAGGVASPAPSGRLMCDVLRPLRLPSVLVGDPRLGGISATLSAYDSLVSRGWDVEAVVLVGGADADADGGGSGGGAVQLDNLSFLREHLSGAAAVVHRLGSPPPLVIGVPACPPPPAGHDVRQQGLDPALRAWLPASLPAFTSLLEGLRRRHQQRLTALTSAAAAAEAQIWWPFTQHAGLTHGSATVIDGRCGEVWTTLPASPAPATPAAAATAPPPALVPLYDASCSWWTQAVTSELQPDLARAVSYAAGRYLHVLFPEVAHTPALAAAAALLAGPGAGWAERVFFSDDGSTAIEVALKMAFRKFLADRGELATPPEAAAADPAAAAGGELLVLGLQGGYHGDTLGSQDCVAPSPFNGPLQSPWYRGRGLFLEPPYVGLSRGRWQILDPPAWLARHHEGPLPTWASLDEMLYGNKNNSNSNEDDSASAAAAAASLTAAYRSYIETAIDEFEAALASSSAAAAANTNSATKAPGAVSTGGNHSSSGEGPSPASAAAAAAAPPLQPPPGRLAACIMEPLLQGAGGMQVVEPGFQRALAQVCRARRLPLILDEVFSGLLRTGRLSAAAALGLRPDIACYAKLLTGGAVPLAATLASGEVFRAFSGPSKLFALLHGHSYTAYPIGCAAAAASLDLLTNPATNPNLCAPGQHPNRCSRNPPCDRPCGRLLPMWDENLVSELSYHPLVSRVVAVGTVLAVELSQQQPQQQPQQQASSSSQASGYGSVGAVHIVRRLRDEYGIYARPLGNVVYVMVPPTAARETAGWLGGSLRAVLNAAAAEAAGAGVGGEGKGPQEESVIV